MPDITNLTITDLNVILPPSEPDLAPDDLDIAVARRVAFYDAELQRLADITSIQDALRDRLTRVPEPPRRETLQELVEAARRRLREERGTRDRFRLDRNRQLLTDIRTEILR